MRVVPRRPRCDPRSSRRPGCASSPTAGSTCSSRRARSSSTSSRSSRPGSATSPCASRRSRRGWPPRACSRRPASGRCRRVRATIAVITSPTGAVWRDICHVLARRWPLTRVVLVAAQVQGEAAPASIVARVPPARSAGSPRRRAEGRPDDAPAVTILARGGGSLEDLWAFNDERVVRAVVAHTVPVVCGVGHEVDVTLADFAADVRAPTPSAAAEIVVPDRAEVAAKLAAAGRTPGDRRRRRRLGRAAREVAAERRALDRLSPVGPAGGGPRAVGPAARPRDRASRRVARGTGSRRRSPARTPGPARDRLDSAASRAALASGSRAPDSTTATAALDVARAAGTLERGYAIVRRADDGTIVRDPRRRRPGRASRCGSRAASCRRRSTTDRRDDRSSIVFAGPGRRHLRSSGSRLVCSSPRGSSA